MAAGNQTQKEMPQNLRKQLALAVRSIQWSYAIFWSISSTQPGMLEWCEGYYNGDIKTRKTVQAAEVNMDDLGLQRSDQLRELYGSLLLGETKPQTKRPTAALSPEDLTDAEWYFLVCMSFVFDTDHGLPARSLAKNKMIWLCNAHQADTKAFSRSLLAKSASVQTVVCFPHLGGVVELGTTKFVPEDTNLIRHINSILDDPHTPEEGLDHLLDDPYMKICSPNNSSDDFADNLLREGSNVEESIDNSMNSSDCISQNHGKPAMITSLSEEKKKRKRRTPDNQESNQQKSCDIQGNDIHYHSVLSNLLKSSHQLILGPYNRNRNRESSFVRWRKDGIPGARVPQRGTPQKLLKKVLFKVARMHESCRAQSGKPKLDEIDRNHVLSERKLREKLNERFMILGSLVAYGGKVDKVSVLDHTIECLRELERKVEELESYKEATERGSTTHSKSQDATERTSDNYGNDESKKPATNKRKGSCDKGRVRRTDSLTDSVSVSVSDNDVLIELSCRGKEHVLLEIMETLNKMHLETHTIQSSTIDGALSITIIAKCMGIKAPSAIVIRQALQKVIRKC